MCLGNWRARLNNGNKNYKIFIETYTYTINTVYKLKSLESRKLLKNYSVIAKDWAAGSLNETHRITLAVAASASVACINALLCSFKLQILLLSKWNRDLNYFGKTHIRHGKVLVCRSL